MAERDGFVAECLSIRCPYCGARPGVWCRAVGSGRATTYLHSARERVVMNDRESRCDDPTCAICSPPTDSDIDAALDDSLDRLRKD